MSRKQRDTPARRWRNRVVVALARLFAWFVPKLPLTVMQRLACFVGRVGALAPGKRKKRVRDHLRIAFPSPEYDADFRKRLMAPAYETTVQIFFESLWVSAWQPDRDDDRVRLNDAENWRRTLELARERGKGLVIFTAHLGTPEIMGRWFVSHCGLPVMAVAARPKIPELVEPMIKRRQSSGLKLVFRGDAGMATLRHLRGGGALIMFVDHNLKGPGVDIPFFGKPAHTLLAPARLALQSGAVATTMFGLRDGTGRFIAHCDEPMELPELSRNKEERFRQEAELALEYTRRIETAIRQYPDQYLWMHKRWQKRSGTLPFPSSS